MPSDRTECIAGRLVGMLCMCVLDHVSIFQSIVIAVASVLFSSLVTSAFAKIIQNSHLLICRADHRNGRKIFNKDQ